MNAQSILILYLVLLLAKTAWEIFLELLNMHHVQVHKWNVPEFIKTRMDTDTYLKAVHYTMTKERFALFSDVLSVLFIGTLVLSGLLGILDNFMRSLRLDIYTTGIIYIIVINFINQLFSLPFALYGQFVIEEQFGFNKMTMKLFFADQLKGIILALVIAVPLLYLLFFFMDRSGELWWLWAFLIFTAFQFLMVIIFPTVIAPLFNKFTPLEEGSLKNRIYNLADKLGFKTSGIYTMDGSKRSGHSNAYFTGLGKTKRIVLFDTLLGTLKEEEIVAVLAHEIGHQQRNHIKKNLALGLVESLAGFFIISLLLAYTPLYHAFQILQPGYHTLLVLLMFCSGPFTFIFQPLGALLSRKYEYEADRFAVKATGSGKGLKNALLELSTRNLNNLTPHPLYSFYHYSHPVLAERIKAIEQAEKAVATL